MENILIIALLAVILGGAAGYVYKSKKRGVKCVGCPQGSTGGCGGNCMGCTSMQEE